MILVLNKDISPQQDARLTAYLEGLGLTATRQLCQGKTILLLSGQTDRADTGILSSLPMVESVLPLADPLPWPPAARTRQTPWCRWEMYSSAAAISVSWPAPVPWSQRSSSFPSPAASRLPGHSSSGAAPISPVPPPTASPACGKRGLALLRAARQETGLPVVSRDHERH